MTTTHAYTNDQRILDLMHFVELSSYMRIKLLSSP